MSFIVTSSDRFAEHQTPPGHPERPERAEVMDVVAGRWRGAAAKSSRRARRRASSSRACTSASTCAGSPRRRVGGRRSIRIPTPRPRRTRSRCWRPARRSTRWSACMGGARTRGAGAGAAARPPCRARPRDGVLPVQQRRRRGGARARRLGAARVAIVDYDVHHGNGTQHIFEADPQRAVHLDAPVSVLSRHRRGRRSRQRRGRGFTVNLPLEAGAVDEDYRLVFDDSRDAGAAAVRAGSDPRVGRVRCARARSARRHAAVDCGVCRDDAAAARAWRGVLPAAGMVARHRRRIRPRGARRVAARRRRRARAAARPRAPPTWPTASGRIEPGRAPARQRRKRPLAPMLRGCTGA